MNLHITTRFNGQPIPATVVLGITYGPNNQFVKGSDGSGHVDFFGLPDQFKELPITINGAKNAFYFSFDGTNIFGSDNGLNDLVRVGDGWQFSIDIIPNPFRKPSGNLPRLVPEGQHLRGEDGSRFTAIECSDFNLYYRYLNNQHKPIIDQRKSAGFNMLRVWIAYDIPGIGHLMPDEVPNYYDRLGPFLDYCNSYGFYVEFTAYTGWNDTQVWTRLCDAVRDRKNVLAELVNEYEINYYKPDSMGRTFVLEAFTKPVGVLSSHGSNGSQSWPVSPYWDYTTFHTNDAPEEQRKIGHNAMEIWDGPTITNETSRNIDRANNPIHSYDGMAGAALLCAGACYHSVHGKTSELWEGDELTNAIQFAAGGKSVNLEAQDGHYNHPIELETPGILRAYQRIGSITETVLIRV